MRDRVVIQRRDIIGQGETGQPLEGWTTVATRWAEVVVTGGAEVLKADAIQGELVHQITMRNSYKVTNEHRLIHNGNILNIVTVIPQVDRLVITAVNVVGEELYSADLSASATLRATAQ